MILALMLSTKQTKVFEIRGYFFEVNHKEIRCIQKISIAINAFIFSSTKKTFEGDIDNKN